VPSNTDLPPLRRQLHPPHNGEPVGNFTLRDLYVRASISGNSMAAELGRYLNIDSSTFDRSDKSHLPPDDTDAAASVHEQALTAIIEVVTSDRGTPFEYVSAPSPQGGVQDWWARMLSGSMKGSQSTSDGADHLREPSVDHEPVE